MHGEDFSLIERKEELIDTKGIFSWNFKGEICQAYFLMGMCIQLIVGGIFIPFILWMLPGKLFESNLGTTLGDVIYTVGVQELRVSLVYWWYVVWALLFTFVWGASLSSRRLNRLKQFGYCRTHRRNCMVCFLAFIFMPFVMFPHGALILIVGLTIYALYILVSLRERKEEISVRMACGDGELSDTDVVTRSDKEGTSDGSESTKKFEIRIGGRDPSPTVPEYNEDTIIEVPNEHLLPMAEAGDTLAQFELGRRFFEGRECLRNSTVALRWLYKARENGSASAKAYIKENLEN